MRYTNTVSIISWEQLKQVWQSSWGRHPVLESPTPQTMKHLQRLHVKECGVALQETCGGNTNFGWWEEAWETPDNKKRTKLMTDRNGGIYCSGWSTSFHEVSLEHLSISSLASDAKPTWAHIYARLWILPRMQWKCCCGVSISWYMKFNDVLCHQVPHNLIEPNFVLTKEVLVSHTGMICGCNWRRR